MGLIPIPGFCSSSYLTRARGYSAARTVNLRVEKSADYSGTPLTPTPIAKAPFVMYPRSGKKLFTQMPLGPTVGAWANIDRVFVAAGGNVYELLEDGTTNLIGAITVGSNPVTMRGNGSQLLICSGGDVFVYTGTTFFQPILNYASGTVDITGTTATWTAGDQFIVPGGDGNVSPGDLFQLASGATTTVASVTDATHLELTDNLGAIVGIRFTVGTEKLNGAMCEFIDGYFIVNVPETKTFRISNLFDGTKWDEIDFATKSGSTDDIGAIISVGGNLALVGDRNSIEFWGDSGNADFPFARINGATQSYGMEAPWSVAKLADGSIAGLVSCDGGRCMVVQTTGGQPNRISNFAVENAIRKYKKTNDAIASTYLENGHSFYRLDFPSADPTNADPNLRGRTWEYDANLQVWSEIGVETSMDETYGADRGRYTVWVTWPTKGPMHLAFDYQKASDGVSGNVWQVDPDFLDDDGVDIPVMRIAPHINSYFAVTEVPQFALDCEMGTIDPAAIGPDGEGLIPTVQMYYSNDGGYNWTDAGAASLGRVGEYEGVYLTPDEQTDSNPNSQTNPQVFECFPYWHGLGSFKISRTFKVKSMAKQLRAIYNGLVEIKPGVQGQQAA
jgi:hypothetical protein